MSVTVILAIGFGLPGFFGMMVLGVSYISFSANVIQFGMDQLHDSPAEDSVLFINWFVFTSHLGACLNKLAVMNVIYGLYWCSQDTSSPDASHYLLIPIEYFEID